MYRTTRKQIAFSDFQQPIGMKLNPDNRWVRLAEIVPWEDIERKYSASFESSTGNPSASLRLVLGAMLIQQHYNVSDREVVKMIQESAYLQFFCGYGGYDDTEVPFVPSALVAFRKRMAPLLPEINEEIVSRGKKLLEDDEAQDTEAASEAEKKRGDSETDSDGAQETAAEVETAAEERPVDSNAAENGRPAVSAEPQSSPEPANEGTLIMDASCCPANIRYPQDTSLLNEAREKAEALVDVLHAGYRLGRKPRTYRRQAASSYKTFVLKRKHTRKEIRKQIGKQLRYLKRDLGYIRGYLEQGCELSERDLELFATLETAYAQQKEMYDEKKRRVDNRIVSISQPWARPIVRGKAQAPTEFGVKAHVTISDGFARLDYASFDAFNESTLLQQALESYREREGHYPERVLADKIYRTRANLKYCKERGVRLLGPRLGRPGKNAEKDKELTRRDGVDRIEVERAFSWGKRCAGLGKVWTKLKETTACTLGVAIVSMNLSHIVRSLASLCPFISVHVIRQLIMRFPLIASGWGAGTLYQFTGLSGLSSEPTTW